MADRKSIDARGLHERRGRPEIVAFAGLIAVLIALLLFQPAQASSGASSPARRCFPARLWDAAQGQRPCARIVRVAEDGTVRLAVEDASGRVRWRATVGARDR